MGNHSAVVCELCGKAWAWGWGLCEACALDQANLRTCTQCHRRVPSQAMMTAELCAWCHPDDVDEDEDESTEQALAPMKSSFASAALDALRFSALIAALAAAVVISVFFRWPLIAYAWEYWFGNP